MTTGFVDVGRVFSDAQKVFAAGDFDAVLRLLVQLPASVAADPNVQHLRALAYKNTGRIDEAKVAFAAAERAAPRDPQIINNHANLLMQTGAPAAALPLYDRAIALQPDYKDARLNRALALQALNRLPEALAAIDELIGQGLTDARVHSARGTILLAQEQYDEAASAFDASLTSSQRLPKALIGRARVALERGETDAVARYRDALAAARGDADVLLGLADALEAEGDPAGLALLADAVAARPDWIGGLERVARMRAETGDKDFTAHYLPALGSVANQRPLRLSLAKMLAGADCHGEALAVLKDIDDDPALAITRAFYNGEAGAPHEGLALLNGLDGPDAALIEGRLALAIGALDQAGAALDRAVALAPDSIAIWAHRELLWRAASDDRALWLSGQDGLVAQYMIGLDAGDIAATAELLRGLHRTRAHPIGQSLRGGTQTRGRLLLRPEPEIRRLRAALGDAVADHIRALPPADPHHPLLRHRSAPFAIAGSWSVRLTSSGFHVAHIHPEGLLSSACYFALPAATKDAGRRDGWLEIGQAPPTLNLSLKPLATIEPLPGRLALFPSYLYHGTRPFADGERLTVAFDVIAP